MTLLEEVPLPPEFDSNGSEYAYGVAVGWNDAVAEANKIIATLRAEIERLQTKQNGENHG